MGNPRGGGVAILCKDGLDVDVISSSEIKGVQDVQFLTVKIKMINNDEITVTSIYNPPRNELPKVILNELMSMSFSLVMGDLNCRNISLGSKSTDKNGVALEEIMDRHTYLHQSLPTCLKQNRDLE